MIVVDPGQSSFASSPHGRLAGPGGLTDWVLLGVAVLLVIWVAGLCARYLLHPGEDEGSHIKRRIIYDEPTRP